MSRGLDRVTLLVNRHVKKHAIKSPPNPNPTPNPPKDLLTRQ